MERDWCKEKKSNFVVLIETFEIRKNRFNNLSSKFFIFIINDENQMRIM